MKKYKYHKRVSSFQFGGQTILMSWRFMTINMHGGTYNSMKYSSDKKALKLEQNGVCIRVQPKTINNIARALMKLEDFPAEGSYLGADYRYRRKRKTMKIELEINL